MAVTYFFDTYALIELVRGNPNYKKYMFSKKLTTRLNLLEMYASFLRDVGETKADYYYNFFLPDCIEITDKVLKKAAKLWLVMRKEGKRPSHIDCIGYIIAVKSGVEFLTGDKEFRDVAHVEFVQ